MSLRVGIVAGEPSGDLLAAELLRGLRKHRPDLVAEGVGGERMRAAGCKILYPMERLAVMGLAEVLTRAPGLWLLRNNLAAHFSRKPPDVFIGVDAPDFTLGLERKLRKKGVKTIHYVCPAVWAWRAWRVRKIRKSCDLLLSVLPFEQDWLRRRNLRVQYVGHPLAERMAPAAEPHSARRRLGLSPDVPTVALLPGSRRTEWRRLARPFLETANWLRRRRGAVQFVSNAVDDAAEQHLAAQAKTFWGNELQLKTAQNSISDVLAAADVALLGSGTVALEAMLHGVPMVVAYRVHPLTFQLARALIKVKFVALPNLLANQALVPEFFQGDCRAAALGPAVEYWLDNPARSESLRRRFSRLRQSLRATDADAAAAVMAKLA